MIFVTVGTHEQSFTRLIKAIDKMLEDKVIEEEVFIQTGFSDYTPRNCLWSRIISYNDMDKYTQNSRIVITHGGPGSIFLPFKFGKIPIVVPRKKEFREHVDDHQVLFTRRLERINKIIAVYGIHNLENAIINYNDLIKCLNISHLSSNTNFIHKFEQIVNELV
jgi:UDP-N-acetylglucosamine transferase subunit ALG13